MSEPSIAFDYGATLRVCDGVRELRSLVYLLNQLNIPVVIVSAVSLPVGRWEPEIRAEILQLSHQGVPLKFAAVRFVYYPPYPTPDHMTQVGRDKAIAARQEGASILFDDNEWVARGAAESGFPVVRAASWPQVIEQPVNLPPTPDSP